MCSLHWVHKMNVNKGCPHVSALELSGVLWWNFTLDVMKKCRIISIFIRINIMEAQFHSKYRRAKNETYVEFGHTSVRVTTSFCFFKVATFLLFLFLLFRNTDWEHTGEGRHNQAGLCEKTPLRWPQQKHFTQLTSVIEESENVYLDGLA